MKLAILGKTRKPKTKKCCRINGNLQRRLDGNLVSTLNPHAKVFIPVRKPRGKAPHLHLQCFPSWVSSEELDAFHLQMHYDLQVMNSTLDVNAHVFVPGVLNINFGIRPPRTSKNCPRRVRYSIADYNYNPVGERTSTVQFTPAMTARGVACKRCLRLGKLCFQHK